MKNQASEDKLSEMENLAFKLLMDIREMKQGKTMVMPQLLQGERVSVPPRESRPCKYCGRSVIFFQVKSKENGEKAWYVADLDGKRHYCSKKRVEQGVS